MKLHNFLTNKEILYKTKNDDFKNFIYKFNSDETHSLLILFAELGYDCSKN